MTTAERTHWLNITDDREWRRNSISDPNISLEDTVAAIMSVMPSRLDRVLEIGCGYGRLTREVGVMDPATQMWGQDISARVLEHARRYDPATIFVCSAGGIAIPGLDAVYSVAVFQHLPHDEQLAYVRRAFGALRPGGVLRIQYVHGVHDAFNNHHTTTALMTGWFQAAGFKVIDHSIGLVHPDWAWIGGVK